MESNSRVPVCSWAMQHTVLSVSSSRREVRLSHTSTPAMSPGREKTSVCLPVGCDDSDSPQSPSAGLISRQEDHCYNASNAILPLSDWECLIDYTSSRVASSCSDLKNLTYNTKHLAPSCSVCFYMDLSEEKTVFLLQTWTFLSIWKYINLLGIIAVIFLQKKCDEPSLHIWHH